MIVGGTVYDAESRGVSACIGMTDFSLNHPLSAQMNDRLPSTKRGESGFEGLLSQNVPPTQTRLHGSHPFTPGSRRIAFPL